MARLFITPREIDFIADINKEIVKDIIGQKIYYYHVREDLSEIHDVYEEAVNKVFDPPIEIDARVNWEPSDVTTDKFGMEYYYSIEVYLQSRDLLDKEINALAGDFFSYGDTFFEITSVVTQGTIYGQIEHTTGVMLQGKQARIGLIDKVPEGPTDESYSDDDAIQETFVQQRGFAENAEGPTGDVRSLQEKGVLTKPISGPAEVSPKGGDGAEDEIGMIDSAFYADS
tara:strand:+ start:55927 stop:56610 length:684 start_codon:yes stop_codon:yes gene_type:complete